MFPRLSLAALVFAAALAQAQTLTLGTKLELNTLDPHFFASFPTNSSMEYFFDKLVDYDERLQVKPMLATSWKLVDNLTWEFKLRKGVAFHDGTPFTADDVIFTIDRVPNVPNSPNSFSQFTRAIESVRKVDDQTILVKTKAPNPQQLQDFANVFIVSAKAGKGASTADYNSGKAVSAAGNRDLIAKRVMEGRALPASQLLSEHFPTSSRSLKPDPYDPAKARALLAEAGWPDGFRLVLHATSDRYPNDSAVAQV